MKQGTHNTLQEILTFIGGAAIFLFLLSFMAHDKFFNPDAPAGISLAVAYFWGGCIFVGITSFFGKGILLSRFESKNNLSKHYSEDQAWAIQNEWCPKCLGVSAPKCPDYDIRSKRSLYKHGVVAEGGTARTRRSHNPYIEEQEVKNMKELQDFLTGLKKQKESE